MGLEVTTPARDLKLEMLKSSNIEVVVEFGDKKRPEGYIVEIEPEGGSVVGSWGGSGNIDKANTITFKNVPPGKYVLKGRPNPGSANEETEPHTVRSPRRGIRTRDPAGEVAEFVRILPSPFRITQSAPAVVAASRHAPGWSRRSH